MLRKSLFNKFAAITVSLALAMGFFSCGENAGLGSSIDTKAPTLAIEYPPSGAAIRDSFILAGSCSDDKAISRVLVTVKRLESDIEFEPLSYTATVSVDAKSWQIKLNEKDEANESYYNGWQLPDGKYEMSVTAYDNVGNNSGASSRSFEIDNTPPLFIISNPGVVKNENKEPSAYGSVFTIDGTIADNHEIASMDVEIYNEAGELLSKEDYNGEEINSFREEEIPTAGGTSVQIAQYVEGESKNRYSTLHPGSSGTEYYYAKITLADATQVYQNPPKSKDRAADEQVEVLPEDLVGNKSSKFYLYDDVYTSLISKKNGKGLSAAALKDIVSGIISDKATLAYLANAEKDSSNEENYLCFSLNPEANPTYNISGFGYEYNNVYQSASCGNTVNITINSGLDNVAVNPGTVKVWLKEFDSVPEKEKMTEAIMELAGKVKNRESVSDGGAIFDDETADEDKKIDDWSLIYDYSNYSGSSVSTKTFAITLPSKGIALNKYYVLAVTGYDVDEVAFKQDAVYAFAGNVSGIAPTIEINSPDNGSFVKAGEFSFEGTAVVNNADLNVKSLEATIKATNGTQAIGNEEGYSVKVTYDSTENHWPENDALAVVWNEEESVWKWTFTPSKIKDFLSETKDATKYALSIKGVSSSDHDVTMSSMVQLDITPPVVSINTITPIVEGKDFDGSNNVYINGTVRIMGTIVEQNLKEVTYDIFAKTEDEDDFVSILEMMNEDSQGSYSSDLYDGKLEQSYSIDISFPTTYLTAYYAKKTGKADPKITIKVTLMAEDIVGNKGEYSSTIYNKTIEYSDERDFIIYQETDRPKITLDNAFTEYKDNGVTKSLLWKESDDLEHNNSYNINTDHNLFGTVSNNRLQVSASDDDALSAIRISVFAYKDDKDELVGGGSSFFSKTTGTYKCDLPDEEGVYKVKVEAFDSKILPTDLNDSSTSFGYNSTDEFYIAISSGAPNIEISKPYAGSYQSGTVDIAGSVTKKEWIKSVEGVLNQNGELLESIVVSEPAFASQEATAWNSSVTLPTNASGNYSLVYTVTDRFGQKNSVERSFMVDIYPPKFKIEEPDSENRNVFTKDGIYTVKGSISDGEGTSGIKGLYYSLKAQTESGDTYKPFNGDKLSDDWQQASVIAKEKGQFTWTANIDLTGIASTDGSESNTVYFAAIDEAGNISLISENSDSSSLKITRDTVSPSTTLLGSGLKKPAGNVVSGDTGDKDEAGNLILKDDSELEESLTYYANGSYTLSGLVTEVSPADVTITAKMGTNDLTVTRDETNSKKWSVVGGTDEGTHAYEITFTDKAGNSVTKKISVIKDSEKPSLTVSNETTDKDALVTNKLITEENTNHSIENGIHKYLLSGKWSDKTSGTGKLQYCVRPHKEDDSYVDSYSDWRDISDVTTSTAESSWSFKVDMLEGYGLGSGVWMQGRAIDAAGNITYTEEYEGIRVDFGKPTVTKTSEVPEYVAKDGKLTITGTVSDSYKLSSGPLTVIAKIDGTEVANGKKGFSFTQNVAEDSKTGTYTITVDASDSNNGTWTFEVKANDWADRESAALSFSTTVDTVAPAWNEIKVNNELYDSDADRTWYKNATLPFSGSLTETGSKVKEIQWSVIKAGASKPAEGDTGTVSPKADNTFNTNIGEFIAKKDAGGNAVANTVKLVAVDYAGNKSVEKTFNIYIDSEAPTLVKSNKDGTQFSNKEAALDVALEASDDASGVKSVTLSITLDGSTTPLEISSGKTTIEATETSGKWNATIPSTFLANLENKTYAVKAKIADKAKNTSDMTLFRIDVDDEKPTIGKLSVTNTNSKYSVYKSTTETETYFVHNADENKFEILGAVQDAKSGVARVELWNGDTKLGSSTSLPIADIDLDGLTDKVDLTLKAFDNAGNVQTQDIVVNFDNDAPKGIHAIDEKNKDLFFRVGKADSDETEITKTGENPLWNDTIDLDVGGKYANDSYSNSQTIRLRGTMHDAGSGVEMIYYKVINSTSELSQDGTDGLKVKANDFLKNYKTDNNGYFKADKVSKKRVTYTSTEGKLYDTNGDYVSLNGADTIFKGFAESFGEITFTENGQEKTKKYATITTNYDNSFTGFDDGYNYLILVAVDNVGNTALDTVTIVQGGVKVPYSNFSLNVDTETPKLESNTKNTQFTNCAANFDVDGTFEDNASGVKSVVLDIVNDKDSTTVHTITLNKDSTGWTQTETNNGKSGTWRATIPATNSEIFPENTTATFSVIAKVTDVAGNSSSSNIFNIQIDRVAPEFKNTLLATTSATYKVYRPDEEADTYNVNPSNGTFSISGVATDDYGVAEVSLSIPGLEDISPVENASFNFAGLDLSGLSGTSTTATLTVTDKAGNTATKPVTINFDKTGPSLVADDFKVNDATFDTAENAKNWYKDNLLSFAGSYTDSLSEIEKVTYTIVPAGSGTQSTGTFSTTKGTGDNAKKETFTTNLKGFVDKTGDSGEAYNLVKLTAYDKVGNPSDEKQFQIWIDTTSPTIVSDTKTTRLTNRQSDIKVTGSFDDNASGVKSIVIEVISDKTKAVVENGTITINSAATGLDASEKTWAATISKSILPTDASESCTVKATITDNAGNPASPTLFNIQIDTEAPAFKNTALVVDETVATDYKVYKPNENVETYYVNPTQGKFKITGVATDNYGVAKVEISIPGLAMITPKENGSFDFTGLDLHTLTGTSVVATLTASDEAGNKSVAKDITINFDSDAPSLDSNAFRIADRDYDSTEGVKNWFKDSLLKFSGKYIEEGCGIEEVQYTITKAGTGVTQSGSFATTVLTGTDADKESFSANLSEFIEKATNTTGNEWNTVKLVAIDKVGNKDSSGNEFKIYIDTTAPEAKYPESETLYSNGSATGNLPKISGTVSDANAGLNSLVIKVNEKEIKGTGIDSEENGVKTTTITNDYGTVTLTKTGTEGTGTSAVTYNEKNWKWEVVIKHSVFSDVDANTASKNMSVTADVKDNAGNPKSYNIANIIVDKKAPTVTLKAPTDADKDNDEIQINGTITLEGTVNDENVLPEDDTITAIRYAQVASAETTAPANNANTWTNLSGLTITGNYSFNVAGFNTTSLTDEKYYYIQAVAKDSAGNTGYSEAKLVQVSQKSDRPKINFTTLTKNAKDEYILKLNEEGTVDCTVSDDDATDSVIVKNVKIEELDESGTVIKTTNLTSSSGINNSGDFSFTPKDPSVDGAKYYKFTVVDNKNTPFTSKAYASTTATGYSELTIPVLKVKNVAIADATTATTAFTYKADNLSPEVNSVTAVASNSSGVQETDSSGNAVSRQISEAYYAGGTERKSVVLTINASDTNGIAGMTVIVKNGNTVPKYYKTADTNATSIAGKSLPTLTTPATWEKAGTFTASGTTATWELPSLDISGKSGKISLVITPYDNSGLTGNSTQTFSLDNEGPTVTITSHKSYTTHGSIAADTTTQYNGEVTLIGAATDANEVRSIKWLIPTKEQQDSWSTLTTKESLGWQDEITSGSISYSFSGNKLLDGYSSTTYASATGTDSTSGTAWYALPIYFRAVDELGNISYITSYTIKFNPDLDKPVTAITYPTTGTDSNPTLLGGTIRMTGTSTITQGAQSGTTVNAVYVQIGATNAFGTTDKTKAGLGTGNYGYTVVSAYDIINEKLATPYTSATMTDAIAKNYGFAGKNDLDAWWGIKATNAQWRLNLNENGEMNPSSEDTTNDVYLRACGVNSNGKFGSWSTAQFIKISKSAPSMSERLYQFTTAPSTSNVATVTTNGNVTAEKSYTSGMYIKGQWYIECTATAMAEGTTVEIESVTKDGSGLTKNTDYFVTTQPASNVKVYIPVDSTATYTVTAIDGTKLYSAVRNYSINVDNDAPTVDPLYSDSARTSSISMTKIKNDNYVYHMYGQGTDAQGTTPGSGVDFIAYYFKRSVTTGSTTTTKIELPLPDSEGIFSGTSSNNTGTSSVSAGTAFSSALTVTEDGLYGMSDTNATSTDVKDAQNKIIGTKITSSVVTATNSFIRKGGMVKLSGSYYLITGVGTGYVVVDETFGIKPTSAFFPAAIIVNNTTAENGNTSGGTTTISNDDGDGFVDYLRKNDSGSFTWETEFFSDELTDGQIDIVVVACDKAGNYTPTPQSTTVMLTNHTPRVSKVYLATDLNGDGKYSDNELGGQTITASEGGDATVKFYSALNGATYNKSTGAQTGSAQEVVTLSNNKTVKDANDKYYGTGITMRNKLGVAFEFVGGSEGSGDIYYNLAYAKTTAGILSTPTTGTLTDSDKLAVTTNAKYDDTNDTTTKGIIGLKGFEIATGDVDTDNITEWQSGTTEAKKATQILSNIGVTLWDSTDGKQGVAGGTVTNGKYSSFGGQWTVINIPIYIDLTDDQPPVSTIADPTCEKATGHIDFKSDLETLTTKFNQTSGEYDTDTKISGSVVFTGTITDEKKINLITLTSNKKFGGAAAALNAEVATWVDDNADFNVTTTPATGLTFRINSSEFSTASGHTVTWLLIVDSTKVENVAATDVTFTVTANDGTSDGAGEYQVDVVPYITKLYTSLADSTNDEFTRSATGRYVVRESEDVDVGHTGVRVYGFNLVDKVTVNNAEVASSVTIGSDSATPTAGGTDTNGSYLYLPIVDKSSGAVSITVNSVESLNNDNLNPTFTAGNTEADAKSRAMYNSQADGNTNNRLTDDVYLWVWKTGAFDSTMSGKTTNVTSPMMKFDTYGNYYISYGNGADLFAINKNGVSTDLEICYNKYHNTNVAFDTSGNFYGVATNTDRVDVGRNDATSFTFFSRALGKMTEGDGFSGKNNTWGGDWNHGTRGNYYNGTNKRRLELSQYGGNNGNYNINRVQRPKLTVSGDGSSAGVYMAYYDSSAGNVKFRYGTVTGADTMSGGISYNLTGNGTTSSSADGYHLVASSATTFKPGAYTAVGYTSSGSAVVAWYDANARRLVYSWNDNPGTTNNATNTWQTNAVYLDAAYTGWYVDLTVVGNSVHIAYYDSKSGNLKYAYIPTYNNVKKNADNSLKVERNTDGSLKSGAEIVTVDSYLSVGTNITINVRDQGTGTGTSHVAKYVPYIYYYNTSSNQTKNSIKVAWQKDSTLRDGVDKDKDLFTGAWECMTIPTPNIPQDATVCGGVPTSGTNKVSASSTNTYSLANTVTLGYMTDAYYERAFIKGDITAE